MLNRTPLTDLILQRMTELGLDQETLGHRLGYASPIKAAGRVHALCDGNIPLSAKSRAVLQRLPEALGVASEVVAKAVAETDEKAASEARKAVEAHQRIRDDEEAAWRTSFVPHAVLHTSLTTPTQITMCGMTGGARRWLMVPLDISQPPVTFISQALAAAPKMTKLGPTGLRGVMFFGRLLGIVVNYTPDAAVRFDLDGDPLEVLSRAFRPGEVTLSIGGRRVDPTVMAKLIGAV